jgi:hypothetical protein
MYSGDMVKGSVALTVVEKPKKLVSFHVTVQYFNQTNVRKGK